MEIQEGELMSKRLSKYIAAFDYIDKILIALSSTGGVISVASFASFIGTCRISKCKFNFAFSLTTGIKEKLLKTTRNKKKKLNKTIILARSKLTSISGVNCFQHPSQRMHYNYQ